MLNTRLVCLILLVFLVAAPMVLGQGGEKGQIQGTITDKSTAVVPGVTITIKNLATGIENVIVSESTGSYRFPGLAPGNYSFKAELAGFASYEVKSVVVNVGRTTDVNVALVPAGAVTTITVSEVTPLVETTKTDIGGVIESREVANLPLNSRNFSALAILLPGARPAASWDPTKTRIGAVSVAGAGGRNMETTVDGIENKDNSVGGWVQNVALDGVQEFAMKTQRFSAADGRSQGGLLSIVTKSGSSAFHGSWFTFVRDRVFNTNDYWSNKNNKDKPNFRRWQYGGSIGGPIKKDRAFFFFTAERFQENQFTIVDPNTLRELQALIDAKISIYGATPKPEAQLPAPYKRTMWTLRLDWAINAKNNASLSWSNSSDRNENDQGATDLTSTNFNTNRNYLMSMVWNSAVSARVMNQFVWGTSYWNNLIDTDNYTPVTVTFTGNVGFGTNGNVPQQTFQKKWQFKDHLIWNRGSHGLKFGIDWVTEPWLGGFFGYTPVPSLAFFDNPTTILTDKTKYPQGFSTPGIVQTLNETSPFVDSRYTYPNWINFVSWYVQDDWKVNRKLTLNLGVRYDADLGLVGAGGMLANDRSLLAVAKINHPLTNGFKGRLPGNDMNNLAPRVGFAIDPTGAGKTVIRGGYGLYYDQLFNNINLFAMQQSNPTVFGTVVALQNTAIGAGDMPTWIVNTTPLPPIPSKGLTDIPNGSTGRLVDPDYESPMSQQFSIGFSQEFAKDFVLEADFIHLLNIHESRTILLNYRIDPTGSNPRILAAAFVAAGLASNRLAAVQNAASVNRSGYDGLNIGVRKRLSHRLTFQGSYTLSRARGYGGTTGEFGGSALDQTNYMAKNDYIPTVRDERHRFVWSGVIDLPGGFQVAPIVQFATARPYALTSGADTNKDGTTNDNCIPGTVSPNGHTCPQGVTRNGQRGGYDLDGNWQSGRFFIMDLRVTKTFNLSKIREGTSLGFYFESFNLTNRVNFGRNFAGSFRATNAMTTLGPATGTYGLDASSPYQAQLGVRFIF